MSSANRFTNQLDLAKYCGCSRDALKKWMKLDKFAKGRPKRVANGTYDGPAYKKWMRIHGLRGKASSSGDEPVVTKADLSPLDQQKHRLGELKIQREEEALERERRGAVDPTFAYDVLVRSMSSFVNDMERLLGLELPPLTDGMTTKQQSALNLKRFRETLSDWKERTRSEFMDLRKNGKNRKGN